MESIRNFTYQPYVESIPSEHSYTLRETSFGALFCEEDSISLDLQEILASRRQSRRKAR
jgi:hypothetical protein